MSGSSSNGSCVYRVELASAETTEVYGGLSHPCGISVASDFALVANWDGGNLGRIDFHTGQVSFIPGLKRPAGVAMQHSGATTALVANGSGNNVAHVDLRSEAVVDFIEDPGPSFLCANEYARFIFHSNWLVSHSAFCNSTIAHHARF